MAAVTNGAELTKRLAESGTGDSKLAVCRGCLAETHEKEKRVATADEVIAAIEKAGAGEGTLAKARAIRETGEAPTPESRKAETIEEQLLAGGPEKNPPADTPPVSPDAKAETGPADAKPRKK